MLTCIFVRIDLKSHMLLVFLLCFNHYLVSVHSLLGGAHGGGGGNSGDSQHHQQEVPGHEQQAFAHRDLHVHVDRRQPLVSALCHTCQRYVFLFSVPALVAVCVCVIMT